MNIVKFIRLELKLKMFKIEQKKDSVLLNPQNYLGVKGMIVFIAFMGMFIPLSIDLYLPAMPSMAQYFQTTSAMINLTLVAFFVFFAIGIIVFGPLSDKYGRKKILVIGLILYIGGSIACALALSIYQLIVFRVLQGLGAGNITSIATALVKDCFSGKMKSKILAIVQVMGVLAPMVAPIAGALILQIGGTWRDTFWVLAVTGVLNGFLVFLFQESLPKEKRYQGTLIGSLQRLLIVGKNPGFTFFLLIAAVLSAPYMAYVAMSSYIYENTFALSVQAYSYFFAANSAFAILGPIVYIRSIGRFSPRLFTQCCFGVAFISGLSLFFFGNHSPWLFLMTFLPFTLVEGAIRPLSTDILLEQQKEDIGAASSLINAVHTILGSVGMVLCSFAWNNMIDMLGIMIISSVVLAILLWIILMYSTMKVIGLK